MPASTSALSAICGIHFGETKAPASTARKPASARCIELHLRLQRIDIGQAMLDAVEQDHRGVARLQQSRAMDRAIQTEDEIATVIPAGRGIADFVADFQTIPCVSVVNPNHALADAIVPAQ